jgi:hypothetical protein
MLKICIGFPFTTVSHVPIAREDMAGFVIVKNTYGSFLENYLGPAAEPG